MQKSQIIQPAAMQVPFAIQGDKNIPNYEATGTETSSIKQGFLPITSEMLPPDGNGQPPERTDFNGMFYLSTDFRVFQQNGGLITYDATVASTIGGYPKDAILGYLDSNGKIGFVRSLKEDNQVNFVADPTKINNVDWAYTHILNTDADIAMLNSTISSVQSNLQGQINTNKTNITTLNNTTVKTSGNQTISGYKTFNNTVFVPAVATDGSAVNLNGQSLGKDGYVQYGNGVMIQWGSKVVGSSSSATGYISFSKAFTNTSFCFVAIHQGADCHPVSIYSGGSTTRTTSRIYVHVDEKQGMTTEWIAIGRWK
jgi:hypothetical protein